VDLDSLNRNSESCSPPFALLAASSSPDGPGNYAPLSVRWAERSWPIPGDDEQVVSRHACITALGFGVVGEDGVPFRISQSGAGSAGTLFKGAGMVLFTTKRIVGLLIMGESPLGAVPESSGKRILFSVPLEEIEEMTLMRKQGTFKAKDKGLRFVLAQFGGLGLDLERTIDENRYAHKLRYDDLYERLVTAIVAASAASASAADRVVLDRAAAGARVFDDGDVTVTFRAEDVPPDEPPAPAASIPEVATSSTAKFCGQCGTEHRPEARFCPSCGTSLGRT
jgi:hypothetical protein